MTCLPLGSVVGVEVGVGAERATGAGKVSWRSEDDEDEDEEAAAAAAAVVVVVVVVVACLFALDAMGGCGG
jgi:ABC-type uncharacterized transport system YnjBCD permease subunit